MTDGQEIIDRLTAPQLGRAYGLEVLLRRQSKTGLFGWISYTLSRSERYRDGDWVPYDFDRPHLFNLVAGLPLRRNWDLGLRLQYQSGRPTTTTAGYNAALRRGLLSFRLSRRQARRLAQLAARLLRRRHQRRAPPRGGPARRGPALRPAHRRRARPVLTSPSTFRLVQGSSGVLRTRGRWTKVPRYRHATREQT